MTNTNLRKHETEIKAELQKQFDMLADSFVKLGSTVEVIKTDVTYSPKGANTGIASVKFLLDGKNHKAYYSVEQNNDWFYLDYITMI